MIKSKKHVLQQINRHVNEIGKLGCSQELPTLQYQTTHEHNDGPLPHNFSFCQQFRKVFLQCYQLSLKTGDACLVDVHGKIFKCINILVMHNSIYLYAKELCIHSEELFTYPCNSSDLGIHVVTETSTLHCVSIRDVHSKLVMLPYSNKFVVIPLLHSSA